MRGWGNSTLHKFVKWEETKRAKDFLRACAFPSLQPLQDAVAAHDGADSLHLSWA